ATHFEASVGLPRPIYLVAVASDSPPEDIDGSLYIETSSVDELLSHVPRAEAVREIEGLRDQLSRLAEAHQNLTRDYGAVRTANEAAQQKIAQLIGEQTQLEGDLERFREQLQTIAASTSWRLTRPLRVIAWGRQGLVAPMRSLVRGYPSARRVARWAAKLMWWTVTLQLPRRVADRT